jgi:hypothetical protein
MNTFAMYDERATAIVLSLQDDHLEIATDVHTLSIAPCDALDLLTWLLAHRERLEEASERQMELLQTQDRKDLIS